MGGILTITGNGFVSGMTSVLVGGEACTVSTVSLGQLTCAYPSRAAGDVAVQIAVGPVTYPTQEFVYSTAATPVLTGQSRVDLN